MILPKKERLFIDNRWQKKLKEMDMKILLLKAI